jgi:hypothetical protein
MTSLGQHPVAHGFSLLYDTYNAAARSRLYETYGFSQLYDTSLIQRPVAHSFSQLYDIYYAAARLPACRCSIEL